MAARRGWTAMVVSAGKIQGFFGCSCTAGVFDSALALFVVSAVVTIPAVTPMARMKTCCWRGGCLCSVLAILCAFIAALRKSARGKLGSLNEPRVD